MAIWSVSFYFIIMDEINDETDDTLEDYSEYIITRALAGKEPPSQDNGTNNSYYIVKVPQEYAEVNRRIRYSDEMVYIDLKKETEPARVLKTIFKDAENNYYELTVSIPTIEKEDLRETILRWIIFLYILLLLGIIAINAWILYRSLRPLYVLLKWLDNYTIGEKIKPLKNDTDVVEFKKLNEAVLRSAERNQEVFEQQRLFIGHASHELQTPLAICKNRLEMLSNDPSLTEKQLEEILKTQQTVDHIVKLNKTLLLLSKIENKQFPEVTRININDLINKIKTDYEEVYGYLDITLTLQENAILKLNMNETLASILFNNLLKNAYIHNHQGGNIEIVINEAFIAFYNTGNSEILDQNKIFERFYQKDQKEGSSGLGLALVESICKLSNIEITYSFDKGLHGFVLRKL